MKTKGERDFEGLKTRLPIMTFLFRYLPDGKKIGNEWVSLNPTRPDNKAGSFKVNIDTGLWADFATGDKGGDLIDLYVYLHGCSLAKAYDDLASIYHNIKALPAQTIKKKQTKKFAGLSDMPAAEGLWMYYDYNECFLGYIIRLRRKNPEDKKVYMPFILSDDENSWVCGWHVSETKPLYHAELLKKHPTKPVLIVEGEKTADIAGVLLPDYVCIAWMGGCGNANKVDIEYLKDRVITLWPDKDEPGIKAMNILYQRLMGHAESVHLVDVSGLNVQDGWDLADYDSSIIDSKTIFALLKPTFDISDYPDISKATKKPLDTTANLKHLLKNFNIEVRWNMLKRVREVIVPNLKFYSEDIENASLTHITNLAVLHQFPIRRIDKHLDAISWEHLYHPIRDWILSKPLECSLLSEFLQCVKTTNDELSHILIKRWLISAIALLFNEGEFCAQGVLVIQGEQGTHKTSFIMSLVPAYFRAVKNGLSVDPSRKDDIFTSSEYWIAELGELDATFRKADIARLKSYINNEEDVVRRQYALRNSRMIRRTAFAATVNEMQFLVDTTGNRRWWTISVTEKINTRHGLDMQQIWREVYELWKEGESPTLSESELAMLKGSNETFEYTDPFDEKLDNMFDWDHCGRDWMNATQILEMMGYDKPSKSDVTRISSVLKKRNIQKGIGRLRRFYLMPRSNFDKFGSNQIFL